MRLRISNEEDFFAGLMFIAFGLVAVIISRDYPMGTAERMGPGYFPTYIGWLLIILGTSIAGRSFKSEGEKVTPFAWRPFIFLTSAFCLFGWGIDNIGFVPSLVAVIVLSALGGQLFRLKEVIPMTILLTAIAVGTFYYGIQLPFRLFWWD